MVKIPHEETSCLTGSPVMCQGSFKANKKPPPVCLLALPTINHSQWQVDYNSQSASVPSSEETEFPKKVQQKDERPPQSHRKASIMLAEEQLLYVN